MILKCAKENVYLLFSLLYTLMILSGVDIGMLKLFLLLYADDIIIFAIRTHLAYTANVKKSCYMKQQSHISESVRCVDVIYY